jgi:hypothetical protein
MLTRTIIGLQIRNEMAYHNIRSYPFDSADYDQDEAQLNDAIRVGLSHVLYRETIVFRF